MNSTTDAENDRLLHRLLFFTDAVFAIVLTLLVLELRPPESVGVGGLFARLGDMFGKLLAFVLSVSVVGVFWTAHLLTLRRLARFDWSIAWANLFYLFPVCLIPFVSALMGEGAFGGEAWVLYSCDLIGASSAMVVMWLIASRDGGRLLSGLAAGERLYRALRAASPGLAFGLGLIALYSGMPMISQFCFLFIPLIFVIVELLFKPRQRRGPSPTE